jgi:hypothetical protein
MKQTRYSELLRHPIDMLKRDNISEAQRPYQKYCQAAEV